MNAPPEPRREATRKLLRAITERKLRTVVPMHHGDLPRGTLRAIIRQSGMTEEELDALFESAREKVHRAERASKK